METASLTDEQQIAIDAIQEWLDGKRPGRHLSMSGYAGTGKTFLINYLSKSLSFNVAYVTFTGKASSLLQTKVDLGDEDFCGTIHSLIYQPEEVRWKEDGEWHTEIKWHRKKEMDHSLIIIDEGSMVSKELYEDLDSYGKQMLIVGDSAQLPPVSSDDGFNLMNSPDLKLTHIHRQAENSPIIRLSKMVREGQDLVYGNWDDKVFKVRRGDGIERKFKHNFNLETDIILTATNRSRVKLNYEIRENLGFKGKKPKVGERVICLKNNREFGIYNGMIGKITGIISDKENDFFYIMDVDFDGRVVPGLKCPRPQFGRDKTEYSWVNKKGLSSFDWAYAITCHKSQGSEFENVMVMDETGDWCPWDNNRWLYTAITRAKEKLVIVK